MNQEHDCPLCWSEEKLKAGDDFVLTNNGKIGVAIRGVGHLGILTTAQADEPIHLPTRTAVDNAQQRAANRRSARETLGNEWDGIDLRESDEPVIVGP